MEYFEWLDDDVTQATLNLHLDDVQLWSARSVSKQFLRVINNIPRRYSLRKFIAHPTILDNMELHKGMWHAAREECIQDRLIHKYCTPKLDHSSDLLKVATQDVNDLLKHYVTSRDLTLYDFCTLDSDDVLDMMVDIHGRQIPITLYLLTYVTIPRVQRQVLPHLSDVGLDESSAVRSKCIPPMRRESLYPMMLRTCSLLKNEKPIARFLELHDEYFAFQFHTPIQDQFFQDCHRTTRGHPSLYDLAIRKR